MERRKHTLVVVVARSAALSGDDANARELAASVASRGRVLATLQEARCASANGGAVGCVTGLRVLYW
jgi:hypothetical protein